MSKNANFVSHKKSKQIVDGKPKLPLATDLVEGEIAINFGKDVETLSIKNESGDVVTFSSDNYYTEKKLGSRFTGANSGVTVTDTILWVSGTRLNSVVQKGSNGTANGDYSVAEGYSTKANGSYSHAEGNYTTANGYYSHAEGSGTKANGNHSHAEGESTTANGYYSHTEGQATSAMTECSHAEGYNTAANGKYSHAEGRSTQANGSSSHAEGRSTQANGSSSHAEGNNTTASGESSHAEGNWTVANASSSHAEGNWTSASGQYSHAEGHNTGAHGSGSHAEGYNTTAKGQYSHAEGSGTVASGQYSHAEGYSTKANNQSEHASGQYNVSSSASTTFGDSGNTLFSVGNGTANDASHNAFEIRQNGDIYIVNKDGNDVRLQDEIGNIDVDQVLDDTTSASTNPVSSKAVYKAVTDNELVWTNAFVALSSITSAHTANAEIHVTAAERTAWDAKLDASAYTPVDTSLYYKKTETSGSTELSTALSNKVDKVSGKGLSTNDYTDAEKEKLQGIAAGAEVNVIDTIKVNGTAMAVTSKAVDIAVPTKTSDITNDSNYVSDANYVHTDNNYTTAEKNKLSSIESNAQANVIESVKVNGTALTITNKAVDVTIPTKTSQITNDSNFAVDASYVHTDNNYTTAEKDKLSGIAAGAEVNVNADWNAESGDAQILNKPTLGTAAAKGVSTGITNSDNLIESRHIYSGVGVTIAYDSASKLIQLKSTSGNVLSSFDATAFIKDGMVSNVEINGGNLVITFNSDSDKEAISIPLTSIFNPNNYYAKSETSGKTELQTAFNGKTDTATTTALNNVVTAHTANTNIHLTTTEKGQLHTHGNKTALDSITGTVGTMAYQATTSYSSATQVNTALNSKVDTTAFTNHTGSSVHMTTTEKTNLDSLATNIAAISGITSTKVSNWDGAANNSHTHSNKSTLDAITASSTAINSLTGAVGTMAFQNASSYSSATQVNTALSNKVDKTEYATFSAATNTSIEDLSGQSETVAAALVDLNTNKADKSTTYTKSEIDDMIGDIETLLAAI